MFRIRLKELREKYNLSQYDLAKELNISQSTIGMWENGKNRPRQNTLVKIAQFFNVSVDYLLGRDDNTITTGDIANNNGIIGHNGTINTAEAEKQTTLEQDMLRIFRNADGKTQVKIMQFMYDLEKETEL